MWPKCEECEGKGKVSEYRSGIGVNMDVKLIPCPACNSTGEAAELSADEAAEYLGDSGYKWHPEELPIASWGPWGRYQIEVREKKFPYKHFGHFNGDLTAALNAAARAVKERGKE